jgi:hypothetical protein
MNRRFVMRAALGMAAMLCVLVVLESQADACFKRLRNRGCCETTCCETTCCEEAATAEEPAPVVEAAPAEEASDCCCDPCDCCKPKRDRCRKLFNRSRNNGCCESECEC